MIIAEHKPTVSTSCLLHEYADMQINIVADNARIPHVTASPHLAEHIPPLSPWQNRRRYGGRSSRRQSINSSYCRWSSDGPVSSLPSQNHLSRPTRTGEHIPCSPNEYSGLRCSSSPPLSSPCETSCAQKQDHEPRMPFRRLSSSDVQGSGSVRAQTFSIPGTPCIAQEL